MQINSSTLKNCSNSKLPKLTPEETDKVHSSISITEIEFAVKNFPSKKTPGPDGFTDELRQALERYNTNTYINSSRKLKKTYVLIHSMRSALPRYQNQTKPYKKTKN